MLNIRLIDELFGVILFSALHITSDNASEFMNFKKYASVADLKHDCTVLDLRLCGAFSLGHIPGSISFWQIWEDQGFPQLEKNEMPDEKRLEQCIVTIPEGQNIILMDAKAGYVAKWFWDKLRLKRNTLIYKGGNTGFRKWVNATLEYPFDLTALHGKTGSRKTKLLKLLSQNEKQVIDLEDLAQHRGSVFGNLENNTQPTQQQFENNLAWALHSLNNEDTIYIEYENVNLGQVYLPNSFYAQLEKSTPIYISVSKSKRIENLVQEYAGVNDDRLARAVHLLEAKLGSSMSQKLSAHLYNKEYDLVADGLMDYFDATPGYNVVDAQCCATIIEADHLEFAVAKILMFGAKKNVS